MPGSQPEVEISKSDEVRQVDACFGSDRVRDLSLASFPGTCSLVGPCGPLRWDCGWVGDSESSRFSPGVFVWFQLMDPTTDLRGSKMRAAREVVTVFEMWNAR